MRSRPGLPDAVRGGHQRCGGAHRPYPELRALSAVAFCAAASAERATASAAASASMAATLAPFAAPAASAAASAARTREVKVSVEAALCLLVFSSARMPYTVSPQVLGFAERLERWTLQGAVARKAVEVAGCIGRGYGLGCLSLRLRSLAAEGIDVVLLRGTFFHNEDEYHQSLVFIATKSVRIPAGKTVKVRALDAFCAASPYKCPSNSPMALSPYVLSDEEAMECQGALWGKLDQYVRRPPTGRVQPHEAAARCQPNGGDVALRAVCASALPVVIGTPIGDGRGDGCCAACCDCLTRLCCPRRRHTSRIHPVVKRE